MRTLKCLLRLDEIDAGGDIIGLSESFLRTFAEEMSADISLTADALRDTLVEMQCVANRWEETLSRWMARLALSGAAQFGLSDRAHVGLAEIIAAEKSPSVLFERTAEYLARVGYPDWQAEQLAKAICRPILTGGSSDLRETLLDMIRQIARQAAQIITQECKDSSRLDIANLKKLLPIYEELATKPKEIHKIKVPTLTLAADAPRTLQPNQPIEEIVGQDAVKRHLARLVATAELQQSRDLAGLKRVPLTFHSVFAGAPGTGKTTIARILAAKLRDCGLLRRGHLVEVARSDLVAGYIGQTAIKTAAKVAEARGGVLFIDEAYSLVSSEDSYGQEAIDTLLKLMEDHRDDLVVIAAGYSEPMRKFIASNPGLESRFANWIEFSDYNDDELGQIFDQLVAQHDFEVASDARSAALSAICEQRRGPRFANARTVRQTFEQAIQNHALSLTLQPKRAGKSVLTAADFGSLTRSPGPRSAMAELKELVGLSAAKAEVERLATWVEVTKRRRGSITLPDLNLHMVFSGPPGTGKTTVARLIGRLLKELGLLPSGHVIEADRSRLIGEWLGQTGPKTTSVFNSALGGVLFIDEAYSITPRNAQDSFGAECVDTLLKLMEDNRDKVVVIAAGYAEEMQTFLSSNPGLRSRFSRTVTFESLSDSELALVFSKLATDDGFILSNDVQASLLSAFGVLRHHPGFASARTARQLFEAVQQTQAMRVRDVSTNEAALFRIEPSDIDTGSRALIHV